MNKDYSKKKKKMLQRCIFYLTANDPEHGVKNNICPKIVELLNEKRPKKLFTYCLNRSDLIRGKLSFIFLYTYI